MKAYPLSSPVVLNEIKPCGFTRSAKASFSTPANMPFSDSEAAAEEETDVKIED
jgi:hypothetical protein